MSSVAIVHERLDGVRRDRDADEDGINEENLVPDGMEEHATVSHGYVFYQRTIITPSGPIGRRVY